MKKKHETSTSGKKDLKTFTYRHYRIDPKTGAEPYLGEVEYTLEVPHIVPEQRTRIRAMTEAAIDAAFAKQLADEEAFENLVDAASDNANCDWEG